MSELSSYALLCVTSLFTLMNPLGVMPVFMSMTAGIDKNARNLIARKAVIVALFTLIAFAFSGQLLFSFFGISVESFRIAGGIIFFLMGQDMLQARLGKLKVTDSEIEEFVNDISVTPLAIPMICGPGAITNSIILMEDAVTFQHKLVLVASMTLIALITYIVLFSSSRLIKMMGETGNKIMMRLMGLIVMVIAVEFFLSGLIPIIKDRIIGG